MSDNTALRALETLEAGDWKGAHALVQTDPSRTAAWVHAHLHRMEGDDGNARHWYSQAGREPAGGDFETERTAIRAALLA